MTSGSPSVHPRAGLLAVFLFLLSAAISPAPVALGAELTVELTLASDRAVLAPEDGVPLRFTLTNDSDLPLAVPYWQTPLRGFEADLFLLERDGRRVDYVGALVSRLALGPEDWLRVGPGESISTRIDLSDGYDLSVPGTYSVTFRFPMQVRELGAQDEPSIHGNLVPAEDGSPRLVWVRSDPLYVTTEGATTAKKNGQTESEYCTEADLETLLAAHARGRVFAAAASAHMTALPEASREADSLYDAWFGLYDPLRWSTVDATYDTTEAVIGAEYVYTCVSCAKIKVAYVYPNRPYQVWICPSFFDMDLTHQAGTILHETVHWAIVINAKDYAYGEEDCLALAETEPDLAIENADSLKYFAQHAAE